MAGIKVALLGYGTVGEGVYQAIDSHQQKLQEILGKNVEVAGILVKDINKGRDLPHHLVVSDRMEDILAIPELDIIVDAIVGVEPGYTHLKKAINQGLHVISANKELLANKGAELQRLARKNGVRLEYEAAVAGAIPVIGNLRHLLHVNHVTRIEAILNGTSNFILTQMRERNLEFDHALELAKENGFAEADPSNDIDGWDAFYKIMILSDLLFGKQPDWTEVSPRGIRNLTRKEIDAASAAGYRLKQVASLSVSEGKGDVAVDVTAVPRDHPLYEVEGVDNAVIIEGDLAGTVKLQGPGAGAKPTASAIVQDLAAIYQTFDQPRRQLELDYTAESTEVCDWLVMTDVEETYFTSDWENSFSATPCPGVWKVKANSASIQDLVAFDSNIRIFPIAGSAHSAEKSLPVFS